MATPCRRAPTAQRLLELLSLRHVWIKLSAPYRVSPDPLATRPDRHWLDAILDATAERCVWGSDWPHTPPHERHQGPDLIVPYRALPYERVVDDFLAALPSATLADSHHAGQSGAAVSNSRSVSPKAA